MPHYRIEIDRSLCSGFASCIDTAPDSFVLGDDGTAAARQYDHDRRALDAARGCPMAAITVHDADTGEELQ